MRPSSHHYLLPPLILFIHAVLLLPPLLWRPPTPDSTALLRRLIGAPPARLWPQYAVPLGVLAFAVIQAIRVLASGFPLPHERRRRHLAARIEWGLLFALGVIEEV